MRAALGAGRARIARQLLIETALLALSGALFALLLAMAGARLIADSGLVPNWVDVSLDLRTIVFGLGLSLLAAVLFGLFPIWSALGAPSQQALRDAGRFGGGGRSANRTRRVLVVVQLALALTLLAGSGLLLRSFAKVLGESPGFDSSGVLTAALSLPAARYGDQPARVRGWARILEQVRELPGVESAALSDTLPFDGTAGGASYRIAGRETAGVPPHGHVLECEEGYFKAMGIPVLEGRSFSRVDWDSDNHVMVIDEMLERKQFPAGDAIGSQLDFGSASKPDLYTIVGVVGTAKYSDLAAENREETYYFNFSGRPCQQRNADDSQFAAACRSGRALCAAPSMPSMRNCRCSTFAPCRNASICPWPDAGCRCNYLACSPFWPCFWPASASMA